MSISCIIVSVDTTVPQRISDFLGNARFFEVKGTCLQPEQAILAHQASPVQYFLVEFALAASTLDRLQSLGERERPRLVIFGHEESYFLERGAIEPILFNSTMLPSMLGEPEEQGISVIRPQGQLQVPGYNSDLFRAISTETKPVWLLMEPGKWNFVPATEYSELLYVRTEIGIKRLKRRDLLVIEAQKDYLNLVARDENFRVLRSLKSVEARLDPRIHCRVHRSFVVLLEAVHSIDTEFLWVDGVSQPIPIGPNYRKDLLSKLDII